MLGQEVATLVNDMKAPRGNYEVSWDARQTAGGLACGIAGGVYYYRLTAGSFIATKKLILLR